MTKPIPMQDSVSKKTTIKASNYNSNITVGITYKTLERASLFATPNVSTKFFGLLSPIFWSVKATLKSFHRLYLSNGGGL
jgi:hypothetical protein